MPRYASPSSITYGFGPGPITFGIKWIIITNVAMFVLTFLFPIIIYFLGLIPEDVVRRGWFWQLGTYLFLHGGAMHILFNMLGIWMFGVELERMWGTNFFLRYYFVTGVGGGLTMLLFSLLPIGAAAYSVPTIGASGALYGILMAYALYFPNRPVLFMLLFPIPAKILVMIYGGLALMSTYRPNLGVADAAHLGGLVFGYLYLRGGRGGLIADVKYRYLKWKMNRMRRKFDVYSGGRSDWDRKVH